MSLLVRSEASIIGAWGTAIIKEQIVLISMLISITWDVITNIMDFRIIISVAGNT